jgi:carbon monoxide dehydrogenase subunit G
MELNGTKIIAADVATVWAHLNNPDTLQACITGCEELTGSPAEGFAATVKQKVGPVKATFKGAVTLENVVENQSYTIVGEGKGGVAGFAKGGADVTLVAVPEGTELTYDATAKVGGKLAQLGNRIIGGFARKMADQFFENFQNVVEDAPNAGTSASSD